MAFTFSPSLPFKARLFPRMHRKFTRDCECKHLLHLNGLIVAVMQRIPGATAGSVKPSSGAAAAAEAGSSTATESNQACLVPPLAQLAPDIKKYVDDTVRRMVIDLTRTVDSESAPAAAETKPPSAAPKKAKKK